MCGGCPHGKFCGKGASDWTYAEAMAGEACGNDKTGMPAWCINHWEMIGCQVDQAAPAARDRSGRGDGQHSAYTVPQCRDIGRARREPGCCPVIGIALKHAHPRGIAEPPVRFLSSCAIGIGNTKDLIEARHCGFCLHDLHKSDSNGKDKSEWRKQAWRMRPAGDNYAVRFRKSLRCLDTADTALPHDDPINPYPGFNAGPMLSGSLRKSAGRGHRISKAISGTV